MRTSPLHRALLVLLIALWASPATAQATAPSHAADVQIPFDGAVTTGTLPNGLTYYIRHNNRPDNRVMMRLAVKAGSLDEADDQQGLAHVLEHMAFNGTTHFKPGELVAYFESTGTRLGPHVNAYTSFTETVFMLQLPTDKGEVVQKGLVALADYAGGMTLDAREIEKERGVVLEEWRLGLGAGSRIRDKQIPVLYHDSPYAQRLPIGKPEVLKTFTPERLRAFYTTHYRPDRMAVVVVGDIEVAEMERAIRENFGALKNPPGPPPTRNDEVPLHEDVLASVATDPEAQRSTVSIVQKRPADPDGSVADYRRDVVRQLVSQMINERFEELSQKPDARFLAAAASGGSLSEEVDTFELGALVPDGGLEAGATALASEAQRIRRFGFGAPELERAKKWLMASFERAYAERDKTESGAYAGEYVRHFLNGEPSPGIEYELKLVREFLPGVTLEDTNAAARRLLSEGSRVVLAVSPEKPSLKPPTAADLEAAVTAGAAAQSTAWTESQTRSELLERKPQPGRVTGRREIAELGVTVDTLSNGVEVWLKPTDFKNDQVLFSFYARGGGSLAPPEKFPEATLAPSFVMLSGVAGLSATELPRLLAGRLAQASPYVSHSTHGIGGSSTPAEFETALQLLYAEFTAPGNDENAFALLKKQLESAVANRQNNPNTVFAQRVAEINTSGHYSARPMTVERVAALDRAAMASFYRERFANAADFTMFVVGAFKTEDVLPLVATYVGGLPSTGTRSSNYREMGIRFPDSVVRERVVKGTEPKTHTVITFDAQPPVDEAELVRVNAAVDVLELRLRDLLREELGQTYTVSASYNDMRPQSGTGQITISFGAAPENADGMVERVLQEVKRLHDGLPSEDYVNRTKESSKRAYETNLRENGYWLGALQSKHLLERDPLTVLTLRQRVDAVTPALVQEMFGKYFPLDRYTVVTLVPEK